MIPSTAEVEPWQAAMAIVHALVDAGILGRDPVVRAEVVYVIEAAIREHAAKHASTDR